MTKLPKTVREYLSKIGAKGGAATAGVTSPAKKKSSRANGELGGRPPLKTGSREERERREYMAKKKRESRKRQRARKESETR